MDVMAMCSSTPISNQSDPRKIPEDTSTMQNLPSPSLMGTANGSSLPLLTSTLHSPISPVSPPHEINLTSLPPTSYHNTSSTTVNHNLYHQSSTPQSTPSRLNYLQSPESVSQSMTRGSSLASLTSSSPHSLSPSILQSPNDTTSSMWPPRPPTTSYYHQSLPPPPPQYSYVPQSQHQSMRFNNHYSPTSDYLPPYSTPTSYASTSRYNDNNDDSPYIQQTFEQSLAKMGKVVDYCNQIVHFALQYRDMKINYNPWNGADTPQVTDSHLANTINRAYDVLNIVSSLKGEITAKPHSIELSQDEIDWIRKQRSLATHTQTKYKKRYRAAPLLRCHSCNITETPEWRRGPDGARTLCNACGLHFAKITRNRVLSAVQQNEQQQQQQTASNSPNITSTTSSVPENNDNVFKNSSNNNNSSVPTSGTSQQIIEITDD